MDIKAYYNGRIASQLGRVRRLAKRGKTREEIAKAIKVPLTKLNEAAEAVPELRGALLAEYDTNTKKVTAALLELATGYNYQETTETTVSDEQGDIVQTTTKTTLKHIPPNITAINRFMKMTEATFGIDERHKAAQLRAVLADAALKEKLLNDMANGKTDERLLALLGAPTLPEVVDNESED